MAGVGARIVLEVHTRRCPGVLVYENSGRGPEVRCHTTPCPAGWRALVLGLSSNCIRGAAQGFLFTKIRGAAQRFVVIRRPAQRDGGRWCSDCLRIAFAAPPTGSCLRKFAARPRGSLSYDALPSAMAGVGARIVFELHSRRRPRVLVYENSRRGPEVRCHTTPCPARWRALVLGLSSNCIRGAAHGFLFTKIRGAAQRFVVIRRPAQRDGGRWCSDCLRIAFAAPPTGSCLRKFAARPRGSLSYDA